MQRSIRWINHRTSQDRRFRWHLADLPPDQYCEWGRYAIYVVDLRGNPRDRIRDRRASEARSFGYTPNGRRSHKWQVAPIAHAALDQLCDAYDAARTAELSAQIAARLAAEANPWSHA